MSLSQATSPEEAKRELKQQVFLAIQGKYDTRQTTLLIKDMDTITNAIMGNTSSDKYVQGEDGYYLRESVVDIAAPDKLIAAARSGPGKNATKIFMFQRTGERLPHSVEVDGNGRPIPDSVQVQGVTYYRHVIGLNSDSYNCDYWFYSISRTISNWSNKLKFDTWQECRDFDIDHSKDDYAPTQNVKPHIFIGGRHDGDTRQLAINSEFKPLQQELSLTISSDCGQHIVSRTSYYRHHLTVVTGGWSVTRWFYCDEKNIDCWTEQKLLSTLDRINKFFADNTEDSMNT